MTALYNSPARASRSPYALLSLVVFLVVSLSSSQAQPMASGLELACSVSDTVWDATQQTDLTLTISVRNRSGAVMTGVQFAPLLPPNVVLNMGGAVIQGIPGDSLPAWQEGMDIPSASWDMKYISVPYCHDTELGVTILVHALDPLGQHVTETCMASILVKGTNPLVRPLAVTMQGPDPACQGDTVYLDAGQGYTRYQWSTGETTQGIAVTRDGRYWVEAWADSCFAGNSGYIDVYFSPLPERPVITREGERLVVTGDYDHYAWYRDTRLIPQSNTPSILPTEYGEYYVIVYNEWGCGRSSEVYDYKALAVTGPEEGSFDLQLFPQPAHDAVTLIRTGQAGGSYDITVYDRLGRKLLQRHGSEAPAMMELPLRGMAPGLYFLHYRGGTIHSWRLLHVE